VADPSSKESYRLYKKDYETEEEARVQQRAVETLFNEIDEYINLGYLKTRYSGEHYGGQKTYNGLNNFYFIPAASNRNEYQESFGGEKAAGA
jgi:hypothetical protein